MTKQFKYYITKLYINIKFPTVQISRMSYVIVYMYIKLRGNENNEKPNTHISLIYSNLYKPINTLASVQ